MPDLSIFQGVRLPGGFIVVKMESVAAPMVDAVDRPALAKTQISGREFRMAVLSSLSIDEISVTIYHEILEAMTVASEHPPLTVQDFNEGDFERAAYKAHRSFGTATPESIIQMLHFYGFEEKWRHGVPR